MRKVSEDFSRGARRAQVKRKRGAQAEAKCSAWLGLRSDRDRRGFGFVDAMARAGESESEAICDVRELQLENPTASLHCTHGAAVVSRMQPRRRETCSDEWCEGAKRRHKKAVERSGRSLDTVRLSWRHGTADAGTAVHVGGSLESHNCRTTAQLLLTPSMDASLLDGLRGLSPATGH